MLPPLCSLFGRWIAAGGRTDGQLRQRMSVPVGLRTEVKGGRDDSGDPPTPLPPHSTLSNFTLHTAHHTRGTEVPPPPPLPPHRTLHTDLQVVARQVERSELGQSRKRVWQRQEAILVPEEPLYRKETGPTRRSAGDWDSRQGGHTMQLARGDMGRRMQGDPVPKWRRSSKA